MPVGTYAGYYGIRISYNTPGRDVIISTTHEGAQRLSAECLYVGYIPPRGVISDLLYIAWCLRRPATAMAMAMA